MGEAFPVAGEGTVCPDTQQPAGPGMFCETGTGRGDMGRGTEEAAQLIPRQVCAHAGAPGRDTEAAPTAWKAVVAIAAVHRHTLSARRWACASGSHFIPPTALYS